MDVGSTAWELVRDAEGRAVAWAGTVQDVTSTVEAEQALKIQIAQNAMMEAIASAANEASTMTDVLQRASALLLESDIWVRAAIDCHDDVATPLFVDGSDVAASAVASSALVDDRALAQRSIAARTTLWHESRAVPRLPGAACRGGARRVRHHVRAAPSNGPTSSSTWPGRPQCRSAGWLSVRRQRRSSPPLATLRRRRRARSRASWQ